MTATFVTSDGLELAYARIGSGPFLVCHCGGPGFPGATLGDLGGLSGDRALVMLDSRGAGTSDLPPARTATSSRTTSLISMSCGLISTSTPSTCSATLTAGSSP
jgi:hypothetical protein